MKFRKLPDGDNDNKDATQTCTPRSATRIWQAFPRTASRNLDGATSNSAESVARSTNSLLDPHSRQTAIRVRALRRILCTFSISITSSRPRRVNVVIGTSPCGASPSRRRCHLGSLNFEPYKFSDCVTIVQNYCDRCNTSNQPIL